MEMSLLFESFMIFYLLEVLLLVSIYVWYYKESKNITVTQSESQKSSGPTASELIKMRQLANQLNRGQQ
jgi:zona occludens toxin (predicted ATPase)